MTLSVVSDISLNMTVLIMFIHCHSSLLSFTASLCQAIFVYVAFTVIVQLIDS